MHNPGAHRLTDAGPVEFIAHRGESADAPENTLEAFRLAWRRGLEAIELDVRLTADGHLVVCHDRDTLRTTGCPMLIAESTLRSLRRLKLPTLDQALATVPPGGRCYIELKVGGAAVAELSRVITRSGLKPEQLTVISFRPKALERFKQRRRGIRTMLLSEFKRAEPTGAWSPTIPRLITETRTIDADGLMLEHTGPITAEAVRAIRAAGLAVYAWTVNDVSSARRLMAVGVEGLASDRAAYLRDRLC